MAGAAPVRARARSGRALHIVAVCALVVGIAAVCALVPRDPWHGFFDLKVYRGAAQWWTDG